MRQALGLLLLLMIKSIISASAASPPPQLFPWRENRTDDPLQHSFERECVAAPTADKFDECVLRVARELYSVCRHSAACISRGRGGGAIFFKHLRKASGTTLRRLISDHSCAAWRSLQRSNGSSALHVPFPPPPVVAYSDEMRVLDVRLRLYPNPEKLTYPNSTLASLSPNRTTTQSRLRAPNASAHFWWRRACASRFPASSARTGSRASASTATARRVLQSTTEWSGAGISTAKAGRLYISLRRGGHTRSSRRSWGE
jgi:hypothetical protein